MAFDRSVRCDVSRPAHAVWKTGKRRQILLKAICNDFFLLGGRGRGPQNSQATLSNYVLLHTRAGVAHGRVRCESLQAPLSPRSLSSIFDDPKLRLNQAGPLPGCSLRDRAFWATIPGTKPTPSGPFFAGSSNLARHTRHCKNPSIMSVSKEKHSEEAEPFYIAFAIAVRCSCHRHCCTVTTGAAISRTF